MSKTMQEAMDAELQRAIALMNEANQLMENLFRLDKEKDNG